MYYSVAAHAVNLVKFYVKQSNTHSTLMQLLLTSHPHPPPTHHLYPNRQGKGGWRGSNLCVRFDVILSSKHRQRINWQEDQPGPRANSGGWLTVYSGLHHLPAFVIVSYYCPYFSSTPLQAVSCSLFFPHQPCLALLCACSDQSASE